VEEEQEGGWSGEEIPAPMPTDLKAFSGSTEYLKQYTARLKNFDKS